MVQKPAYHFSSYRLSVQSTQMILLLVTNLYSPWVQWIQTSPSLIMKVNKSFLWRFNLESYGKCMCLIFFSVLAPTKTALFLLLFDSAWDNIFSSDCLNVLLTPTSPKDNTARILTRRSGFNRREMSVYYLPVVISDSDYPIQSSTSTLTIRVCSCDATGNMRSCSVDALLLSAGLSTGALVAILLCVLILLSEFMQTGFYNLHHNPRQA